MNKTFQFKRTHHGKLHGVPVWLDMTNKDCPCVEAKYGRIGEIALDFMESVFGAYVYLKTMVDPFYEPMYRIQVGKPVVCKNE